MDKGDVVGVFVICFFLIIFGVTIYFLLYTTSVATAEEEHYIMEISNDSIWLENHTFYIFSPDNTPVEITSTSETLDFTQQSVVYVRFSRNKPTFIYGGSDWSFDGIVKLEGDE